MRAITVMVYQYSELLEDAKDNARYWFQSTAEYDKLRAPADVALSKLTNHWFLLDGTLISDDFIPPQIS